MATTTNYGWDTPDDTDLVKDGAAAIRTLGSSIDTTTKNLNPETTTGALAYRSATANVNTALPIGSAGQVLTVAAGVPSWATPTDQTPLTTKGDVFTFSTVDARLGVGANGTVLTADSAETTGLKWATPAGGGFTLLSTTPLTSTTVTISSISQSHKHLFLYCKEVTSSSNGEALQLRFNADTDTDYTYGYVRNIGTTVAGSFQTESKIQLIDRLQSTSTVTKLGSCGFWVFRYTDTDHIDGQGQALGHDGTNGYNSSISYRYDNGAAITSITLFPSGAGTQGGTAYLYGVN
jgi:hypothetical protein